MKGAAIVAELSAMGVSVVGVPPDRIRLTVQAGDVPTEAVAFARDHKPELMEHLRSDCRPHNNSANYIDKPVPNRPGWIRTTCSDCGEFVGYRPAK